MYINIIFCAHTRAKFAKIHQKTPYILSYNGLINDIHEVFFWMKYFSQRVLYLIKRALFVQIGRLLQESPIYCNQALHILLEMYQLYPTKILQKKLHIFYSKNLKFHQIYQ